MPENHQRSGERAASGGTTRRSVLRSAGAGLVAAAGFTATGQGRGGRGPFFALETDGKWIVDEHGFPFVPRGVATSSLDYIEQTHPLSIEEILTRATSDGWKPNTVRLPVTEWVVHDQGMDHVIEELLEPAVEFLEDEGVYAMIDLHVIRPYVETEAHARGMVEDGWAPTVEDLGFKWDVPTDDLLREFWGPVAEAFGDEDHVLFELYNEPTLPNWWSTYGEAADDVGGHEDSWLLWRETAQPWVDLIREETDTPIVIGSPDWTSETQYAAPHPFEGENLIYSAHIYPANGQPSEFDATYGTPAEDVPVMVTEFGWDPDGSQWVDQGTTSGWGEPFRDWVESYENMGWTGWCFDDTWAPTYFDSPGPGAAAEWTLKDDPEQQGGFMKQWLQEEYHPGRGRGEGGGRRRRHRSGRGDDEDERGRGPEAARERRRRAHDERDDRRNGHRDDD